MKGPQRRRGRVFVIWVTGVRGESASGVERNDEVGGV